jgi:exonuclease SbcC
MSHADSEFELGPCLTVLTGPNNCGKSAVVEALQCVSGNTTGGFMVRHGEREASVTVETSEGDVITWRRIKDKPSFVINREEIFRTQPDNLQALLRLPRVPAKENQEPFDVHFGEQKRPIFLLGDTGPGGRAATFFASSSDAQYLVRMQVVHKQRTADARRDATRLSGEIAELTAELEAFAPLDELEPQLALAESAYRALLAGQQDRRALGQTIAELRDALRLHADATMPAEAYAALAPPPDLRPAEDLAACHVDLARMAADAIRIRSVGAALDGLAAPPTVPDLGPITASVAVIKATTRAEMGARRRSGCLSPLTVPPDLRPIEPLASALADRRTAESAYRRAESMRQSLESLTPPPTLADAHTLALTIKLMRASVAGAERATVVTRALAALSEPPSPSDCESLTAMIATVRGAATGYRCTARSVDVLLPLAAPPDSRDLEPLRETVRGLKRPAEAAQLAFDAARASESRLTEAKNAIRRWAEEQELCPTCGSPIKADTILDHLEVAVV